MTVIIHYLLHYVYINVQFVNGYVMLVTDRGFVESEV